MVVGDESIAACAHNNNKDDNKKMKTTNDDCVCIWGNLKKHGTGETKNKGRITAQNSSKTKMQNAQQSFIRFALYCSRLVDCDTQTLKSKWITHF